MSQNEKINFRHINIENGLSNNTVWSVVQDNKGFMWFGTNDGLNKYDGYDITIYRQSNRDSLSLTSSKIVDLFVSDNGQLWIGTSKGLNLYLSEEDRFRRFPLTDSNGQQQDVFIRSIIQDKSGKLWLGTSSGLYHFDPLKFTFIKHNIISGMPHQVTDMSIYKVVEDLNGILWLCTTEGLYIYNGGVVSKAAQLNANPILGSGTPFRDLLIDMEGNYWFATESLEKGVLKFDPHLNLVKSYSRNGERNNELAGNRVRVIKQFSEERVWIGTFDGLSIFNTLTGEISTYKSNKFDDNSLSQNSIRDIYKDRDGGIWIATFNGGLSYTHPSINKFSHYKEEVTKENGLSDNLVSSFAQDKTGNMWIGTENGLNYFDQSAKSFTHILKEDGQAGLLENTIKTLLLDDRNNLWVGGLIGLSVLNLSTKDVQYFIHDPVDESSIGYNHIQVIFKDSNNRIWIGTQGGGLNKYVPESRSFIRYLRIENEPVETIDNHVWAIVEDNDNKYWVGTENGLEYFDGDKGLFSRSRLKSDGVFSKVSELPIHCLYLSNHRYLIIGTLGMGLYIYDTKFGDLKNINIKEGMPDNTINGILEDNSGNLWVSTNKGISKLLWSVDGQDSIVVDQTINFGKADGIQGFQFYPNSAFKSADGQLFFGGTNGFNSFYPENIQLINYHPDIIFKEVKLRDQLDLNSDKTASLGQDSVISLKYSQSDFSIEFAALNYLEQKEINYAYKLEPIDNKWNNIGNYRVVNYSKLQPGTYTFKVKATNNLSNWGNNYNQLYFTVTPPFWRTLWAYLLYAIVLTGLLYFFFVFASKWGKLKSDLAWEHFERERENEQHQLRIKFFTDISHELRTPLTLILAPLEHLAAQYIGRPKLKNQLYMIQRNGERMLQLINQLLDLRKLEKGHLGLKAGKGDIVKFVREVSLAFRESALQKNIKLEVDVSDESILLWFDRDKMEVILYNLLSNAVKYTPTGGIIGLSVRRSVEKHMSGLEKDKVFEDGYLEISVEDNGIGIPADQIDKVFDRFYQSGKQHHEKVYGSGLGLEVVKKFVELHQGTITVSSIESRNNQPGKTRFTIAIPLGRRHLSDSQVIKDFKNSEDISLYRHVFLESESDEAKFDSERASQVIEVPDDAERPTLLVVEDNEEVRNFISGLFEPEYMVAKAGDGKMGLKLAMEIMPDLVLSDIMMPELDGIELCKRIKTDPRTSHIPVILLTARTAVTFQIKGFETGADDYITKPFSAELLKIRAGKLIDQRRMLKEQSGKNLKLIPEEISITSVDETFIKKTIDFINENISDPDLGVETVAKEVGMSRVHFYRKIKALTNFSAVEFIRTIRLERAAQLLKTGKLNISEVRYEVGFQQADYFRNAFKAYFGETPTDYLRNYLRNNPS